uniref:Potassium channel domain-containing protein n=1 Tax=Catharus ustulatus TaxID=91951 RepID=A0A8C3Y7X0_CATUS
SCIWESSILWNISSNLSFFFFLIGYGTLHPKTAGGQIFCVFFALFGIPLNIVFLHRTNLLGTLRKTLRGKPSVLVIPDIFFQITEGWSYSEGIYFAFITLSTIGFGDYVVGKQSDRKYFSYYRVLVAIWILFGLAWIALLFNLLTTVLEDTEKIIVKDLQQIGKVSKDKVESQQRRCWPVQFIPEEERLPPRAGGDAHKMETHKPIFS